MHPIVEKVTARIRKRSQLTRQAYLKNIQAARSNEPTRRQLACGNLAHGFAACGAEEKTLLATSQKANVALVSAYSDMLSAHQPFDVMAAELKTAVKAAGGMAQFAGGVPAMCDGVTQGQPGMELSLFSRDLVAMSSAVALSHNMFDGVLYLGVCDKVVPGLLIGALSFGHLPALFVPSGPMPSGLANREKARVRQQYAMGEVGPDELLAAESASYHSPGTCTFYGTANSNQLLLEVMGLQLPGSAFVNPDTPLRHALTAQAGEQILGFIASGQDYRPLGQLVDEQAIVNGVVGLLATGGSTNHTIHLVAIAKAAGIILNWDDFSELSAIIPLLAKIYPNGSADINHFQAAGGMACLISTLLAAGLLHPDLLTVATDKGMASYCQAPALNAAGQLKWLADGVTSTDLDILRPASNPFTSSGGLQLVSGNLGRGVTKTSAVKEEHRVVEAPAQVFDDQDDLITAFQAGQLQKDFVAVIRFQGPKAIGMPELHKLTPILGQLQDQGFKVALVTDGRMSGASGKVPAAIHLTPECADQGPLAYVCNGDLITLDTYTGELCVAVEEAVWIARQPAVKTRMTDQQGMGRELFALFRQGVGTAETGASCVNSFTGPLAGEAIKCQ